MELKDFLPIIAIFVSITGLLYQYFGVILKIREDMGKDKESISKDIGEIKSKISSLETKTELFWRCIEGKVVDMLKTYPTNIDKDVLLDKFKENSLTIEEAERLRTALNCEIQNTQDKQFAYILAIARLEQLIYDLRNKIDKAKYKILEDVSKGLKK